MGAIQGHTRMPGEVAEEALGERLTAERCRQLGMIFHASHNSNYGSIRERGPILTAVRSSGQRHRAASHFVYAGGEVSPGPGAVVKYGNYMFYAQLDYESFLNHGHELYLTSNGIVLSYADVAPMYPHEKDSGGLKYEKKQHEAGVGSPQGEVPTLDKDALQKLIREDELKEEKKRQAAGGSHRVRGIHSLCLPARRHRAWQSGCNQGPAVRSSTRFSATQGQIPGISSSPVFCVVSTIQACGWRHHTETSLFGSLRSTVSLPA